MRLDEIRKKLAGKRVGIAGAGGLGSNCAAALARSGVGTLVVADFDTVSEENLNRQFFFLDQVDMKKTDALAANLLRIAPALRLVAHDTKLVPGNIPEIFAGCDVIVEAFDLAEQKEMLIGTVMQHFPDTPLVIGLGIAGYGRSGGIGLKQSGNLYICGDGTTETDEEHPPLAPRVGMVANMQANVVLELLLGGE